MTNASFCQCEYYFAKVIIKILKTNKNNNKMKVK